MNPRTGIRLSRLALSALAIASLVASASAASPHGRHGGGAGPRPFPGERLLDQLDLDAKQRERAEKVLADQRQEGREIHERLAATRAELFEAIHADALDEAAVREIAERVSESGVEIALSRARTWQKLRGILTPAQQDEARELLERRRDHRKDRMRELHEHMGQPPGDAPDDF